MTVKGNVLDRRASTDTIARDSGSWTGLGSMGRCRFSDHGDRKGGGGTGGGVFRFDFLLLVL